jgi:hypothetical protein
MEIWTFTSVSLFGHCNYTKKLGIEELCIGKFYPKAIRGGLASTYITGTSPKYDLGY